MISAVKRQGKQTPKRVPQKSKKLQMMLIAFRRASYFQRRPIADLAPER
jgi:hypothetical protein